MVHTVFSPLHQIQVRYLNSTRYQTIRPLLRDREAFCFVLGMGGRGVRYRISFHTRNIAQVLEKGIRRFFPIIFANKKNSICEKEKEYKFLGKT
jgi:hypothetical protein